MPRAKVIRDSLSAFRKWLSVEGGAAAGCYDSHYVAATAGPLR
jgi:hypothetical protein